MTSFSSMKRKISSRSSGKPDQVSRLPGLAPSAQATGLAITLKVASEALSASSSQVFCSGPSMVGSSVPSSKGFVR